MDENGPNLKRKLDDVNDLIRISTDEKSILPIRLRRAETVLLQRTRRIILVLEQCMDSHNHQAVLRTAEALGIQHVWLIKANKSQIKNNGVDELSKIISVSKKQDESTKKITKNCNIWLTIREFHSIKECILALLNENITIWATDLAPNAIEMTSTDRNIPDNIRLQTLPSRVAIIIGRETDGVSEEMLQIANEHIYFPIYGFSESLNLSVATALVVQRLLDWFPSIRGDLLPQEKYELRVKWFTHLSKSASQEDISYWVDIATKAENSGERNEVLLPNLRREKLIGKERWLSKRVRERENALDEVKERSSKSTIRNKEVLGEN